MVVFYLLIPSLHQPTSPTETTELLSVAWLMAVHIYHKDFTILRRWYPMLWPSARHQSKLQDHRHEANVSQGVPVYISACWHWYRIIVMLNAAARLVFSAKRSKHITPLLRELHWLKSSGENTVSFVCSDTSLSPWYIAPSYLPETLQSSSPVCFDVDTRRTTDTSSHHWWSCVSGCCVACLEFPSNFGQGNPVVTACVPPEDEDSTLCHLFSGRLTVI